MSIVAYAAQIPLRSHYSKTSSILMSSNIFDLHNPLLADLILKRQALIFISSSIATYYGGVLQAYLSAQPCERQPRVIVIPTGEHNKHMNTVIHVCERAHKELLGRSALFIAIGGGVLTDIVAFSASMYRRQTDCIRIGTTLVGQVDASIGIKCGVNLGAHKNLIGAYHPSTAVIVDPCFLKTLSLPHLRCGLAEIIKLGVMKDELLFNLVVGNHNELLATRFQCEYGNEIIQRAIRGMVEELECNPYEQDRRRLMDFGHTFSPYLESASSFRIQHGEAVSIDIALTSIIANLLGYLSSTDLERILTGLRQLGLPTWHSLLASPELYGSLYQIVLHRDHKLNLPLPCSVGSGTFLDGLEDLPSDIVRQAVDLLRNQSWSI